MVVSMEATTTASIEPSGATMEAVKSPLGEVAFPCEGCGQSRDARVAFGKLRGNANYWHAQWRLAKEREQALGEEIKTLQAKLHLRERQLFERKSERKSKNKPQQGPGKTNEAPRRKRGQQKDSRGHGRRRRDHLPSQEESHSLDEDQQRCSCCGLAFVEDSATEDSEQIEIEVRAHRRVIRRKRYKPTCKCPSQPSLITAPGPGKLIPKGLLAVSFWVHVLLDKFLFQRPTYRLLTELRTCHELDVSQGTVTDGLKRLAPLFEPLYQEMARLNTTEHHWHADETRWLVFAEVEGKIGNRWYLWVFRSSSTVVYTLAPTRSADVPRAHFGSQATGILSVDRYVAYKALIKDENLVIQIAFCWAHVRRDFLGTAKDWPELEDWGFEWVNRIGNLYRLNEERLAVLDEPSAFAEADTRLRTAIDRMKTTWEQELQLPDLNRARGKVLGSKRARRKVLESLERHWPGLIVFVDHPEVPMDNNQAERDLRNPVVGRKNYYGSGAVWSGQLAAMLFSLFQTLMQWKVNPRRWLTEYLEYCAQNNGHVPEDAALFLPWNLPEQELRRLQNPYSEQWDTS